MTAPLSKRTGRTDLVREVCAFIAKQASACLFGIAMLGMIVLSRLYWPADAPVARYDALFAGAVAIQILLLVTRLETWEEARVILMFHIVGTVMEFFKTAHGSWAYPEENLIRIAGVPLFSGFMYSAVGSYIARSWRLFDFRFDRYPPPVLTYLLCAAVYVNFFAHHYTVDIRLILFVAAVALFWRCSLHATLGQSQIRAPLLAAFVGVAFLIWVAENLATYGRAWVYPAQAAGWTLVPLTKMGAWFLLMLISFVLVAAVKRPERSPPDRAT